MIYCVEDDAGIRELMVYTLNSTGMEAMGFEDAEALFRALSERELPELLLLDIMLPGKDGISILKELRQDPRTRELPVIMASAKGTEYDKVTGLDLGADDYLAKPFGMMEMLSRVKAVLRRAKPKEKPQSLQAGSLVLDLSAHSVTVEGKRVELTYKEYEMLRMFLEHPGRVFTRDQLLESIWGYGFDGETRTVDVHIRSLRTKLGPMGALVETVRGVGYRLGAGE